MTSLPGATTGRSPEWRYVRLGRDVRFPTVDRDDDIAENRPGCARLVAGVGSAPEDNPAITTGRIVLHPAGRRSLPSREHGSMFLVDCVKFVD